MLLKITPTISFIDNLIISYNLIVRILIDLISNFRGN